MERRLTALLALCAISCADPDPTVRHLEAYPNPAERLARSRYEPQPHRENPRALALSPDGSRLFVALQGSVDAPGHYVAELDADSLALRQRHRVGSSPTGLAMHPDGRFVVVTNRLSDHLSVIDTETSTVTHIPADFYAIGARFAPDGSRLYVTNRWRDALRVWDARVRDDELVLEAVDTGAPHGIAVGDNPYDVVTTADGKHAFVGSTGGLDVTMIDTDDWSTTRLDLGAPVADLAVWGHYLYVATLSASTHHPATSGPDTDGDGHPGDGTANEGFRDLQNELAVFDLRTEEQLFRYTSDSICCPDVRDVPADDPMNIYLPDPSTWIVGGALPERLTVTQERGKPVLVVVYSGSNEAQRFTIDTETGALTPGSKAQTGYNPSGLAVGGFPGRVYVANRLGESITVLDLESFRVVDEQVVGDTTGGAFPATDAELGELYFFAGAGFAVDGDQTCSHCHREQGNIGKTFSMPLLADADGSRATPASRGMVLSRPWFIEGGMDESNLNAVINEFARADNFCCMLLESGDPYSTTDESTRECMANPPPQCAERPWPRSFASRDLFLSDAAQRVLGRRTTFGGRLRASTAVSFASLTSVLGTFLVQEPALLPNPNPAHAPDARRGRAIFNSAGAGCAACHPPPGFTVTEDNNPADMPVLFPPLVTPNRTGDGRNLDLLRVGFLDTFPGTRQLQDKVFMNAPTLLGLWDRTPPFLHDGRAHNLREVLCPPGHPALKAAERGFNELNGIPDTHGGTSHLSPGEIEDLIAYLHTL